MSLRNYKIIAIACAYNEEGKIGGTVSKLISVEDIDEVVVVNDASTDNTAEEVIENGGNVLSHRERIGAGGGIKTGVRYALENGYDIIVLVAGNDKDKPSEICRLVQPIVESGYDLVQGSRYLSGGMFGNMPFYRQIATRYIHPILFSLIAGRRMTDSTNGFRAIRLSMFNDERINIDQDWLDKYELEPYLYYKAIKLGYKVKEVPVTKIYPPRSLGYTKMKAITGWWSIIRPLVFLALPIKK